MPSRETATGPRSALASPTASVDLLFNAAAERSGLVTRSYAIGGRRVQMRFAGETMLSLLGRSFAHLEAADGTSNALTIQIWDAESTGTIAPPALGAEIEGDGSGPIYYYEDAGVRAISRWNTLTVYDRSAGRAWFWAPAPSAMLSWDWASPMRAILHWWLGDQGLLQVHGGAVGTESGGVLVVGRGGSGKSTTTLACLDSGLVYAGDDFVAVDVRPQPHVHSLYSSGKLETHHLERFPRLLSAVVNPVREPEEKAVVYAAEYEGSITGAGFPLRAVLVPRVTGRSDTSVVPTSPADALAALAPSTIFQLHPPQPYALAEMAELARRVPCFSLELGTELEQIPEAVSGLLRRLAA